MGGPGQQGLCHEPGLPVTARETGEPQGFLQMRLGGVVFPGPWGLCYAV